MNNSITANILESALSDILSLFNIPTKSKTPAIIIKNLWNAHCEKKLAESRDILFDEITQGNFNNIADDEKISLMHRYTLAAMNGTARLNLRLLAKAINSIVNGENSSAPIYANEFNRYAQILETLSDEEIQLLAVMYQYKKNANLPSVNISHSGIKYTDDFIQNFAQHYQHMYKKSDEEYKSLCGALLRTGLIYQKNIGFGGSYAYALSPLFDRIIELVDFQDALDKEKQTKNSSDK